MITYDFDAPIDRFGTDSLKFDRAESFGRSSELLSLWVADMDFKAPVEVVDAIVQRANHGIFGYTDPGDDYYRSVSEWMRVRQGWEIDPGSILITPGVVFALAVAVRAYTQPGDAVLFMPPVYYPFAGVIEENGRALAEVPLVYPGDGGYEIDFDRFERVAAESSAKLLLLCSPHNPVGRVWHRDELERLARICCERGITIVSDEIHADFIRPGSTHIPIASLSPEIADITVTATSASKTFNLAGLQVANIIISNQKLRHDFRVALEVTGYSLPNTLGLVATKAAYEFGASWLDQLNAYLEGNWALLADFLEKRIPQLQLVEAEGTYLAWVDCRALGLDDKRLERFILDDAGLWLDQGHIFGKPGSGFIRINIATQRAYLLRALEQLAASVTRVF